MIKSIDENAIDKVINFSWQICQKRDRTSYPIKKSKLDLEKSFIKALKYPNDKVLGYFKDDTLIGSINIFVEVQESYLRVVTYIEKDFEEQDSNQYEIAKQMGFEDKGGFRCYSIDL